MLELSSADNARPVPSTQQDAAQWWRWAGFADQGRGEGKHLQLGMIDGEAGSATLASVSVPLRSVCTHVAM